MNVERNYPRVAVVRISPILRYRVINVLMAGLDSIGRGPFVEVNPREARVMFRNGIAIQYANAVLNVVLRVFRRRLLRIGERASTYAGLKRERLIYVQRIRLFNRFYRCYLLI